MRTDLKIIAFLLPLWGFMSCKPNSPAPIPTKAILTFPNQNSVCVDGGVISPTQNSVTFRWEAAGNTDSYELTIKNLLTNTIIKEVSNTNKVDITLLRNTPYSWFVISKSGSTTATAQSDIFKFYNSGAGIVSHTPFPSDLISPSFGQNITDGTVNLNWKGSDVDNDIVGYDVYLGITSSPALLKSNVKDLFLNNTSVISGTSYYWKIITKDLQGNTSESDLFQFKVN